MPCYKDLDLSTGPVINTYTASQTEADGDLTAASLAQYQVISVPFSITDQTDASAIFRNVNNVVGIDIMFYNPTSAINLDAIGVYFFDTEPLNSGVSLPGGALFSTIDNTYIENNLIGYLSFTSLTTVLGHIQHLYTSQNIDAVNEILNTATNSNVIWAVLVSNTATATTIDANATLTTKFKFRGVDG